MRYFYCDKFESMLIYVIYRIRVVIKHSGLFFSHHISWCFYSHKLSIHT